MKLEEAKELFFSSNCSKFEMGRENPSAYKQYTELNIKKEEENKWREEKLYQYILDIENGNNNQKLWLILNKIYDWVETIKNKKSISAIRQVIKTLNDSLNENEKVVIAEIIIGRKARSCRSGLIYLSYDLGDINSANLFASKALELLEYNFSDNSLNIRAKNASILCYSIMKELSLNRVACD